MTPRGAPGTEHESIHLGVGEPGNGGVLLFIGPQETPGKEEVDRIICWLTGYDRDGLRRRIGKESDFGTFFAEAPEMNSNCTFIKGVVCGALVEEIEDPLMRKVCCLDKRVDELARGKAMEKILRQ